MLEIDSKYTKQFYSESLTMDKYDSLYGFAVYIRDIKNEISKKINDNILYYIGMNQFEFVTLMRKECENDLTSSFDSQVYRSVINAYDNKFNAIIQRLSFEKRTFESFELYKRNCKSGKKGELNKVNYRKEKTPLSICLTYLARYGNEDILNYIISQLNRIDLSDEKKEFYNNIILHCNKFGIERLLRLALSKRNRVVKHYCEKPIEFKSLTFSGKSRKKIFIGKNKNEKSFIKIFANLSWNNKNKSLFIPLKYSEKYHGDIDDYLKNINQYDYLIKFDEPKKQVSVLICKDGKRYLPEVNNNDKTVGIDINVKHNLFALSNGETFDYDRKLLSDYCKLCLTIDESKKKNKEYKIGKKKQKKLDTLRLKIIKSVESLAQIVCKKLHEEGVRHIVLEDLTQFGKTYSKSKDFEEINYNRIIRALHISDIKSIFEHIAINYDIAVSTVQSNYTSKMCPICGCIADENRLSQEDFCCINCGHKDNADHNAAVNIRNRVLEAVLREDLLKQRKDGSYEPKRISKDKIKEKLSKYAVRMRKNSCNSNSVGIGNYS